MTSCHAALSPKLDSVTTVNLNSIENEQIQHAERVQIPQMIRRSRIQKLIDESFVEKGLSCGESVEDVVYR